jgi:hypothetical protein
MRFVLPLFLLGILLTWPVWLSWLNPPTDQTVSLSAALSSAARVCASSVPVHIVESSFLQQRSANKQLFGHSLFLLKNGSGLERESIRDSPGNPGRSTPMFPVTVANHHTILAMSLVLHRLTFNSRMRWTHINAFEEATQRALLQCTHVPWGRNQMLGEEPGVRGGGERTSCWGNET